VRSSSASSQILATDLGHLLAVPGRVPLVAIGVAMAVAAWWKPLVNANATVATKARTNAPPPLRTSSRPGIIGRAAPGAGPPWTGPSCRLLSQLEISSAPRPG
jgi:hypothetical protein